MRAVIRSYPVERANAYEYIRRIYGNSNCSYAHCSYFKLQKISKPPCLLAGVGSLLNAIC